MSKVSYQIMEGFLHLSDECKFSHDPVSANPDHNGVGGLEDVPLKRDFSFGLTVPDHGIGDTSFSKVINTDFAEETDIYDSVLKHIDRELMEDDSEDKAWQIEDSALRVAEKPFYDALNDINRPLPNGQIHHQDSSSSDACISNSFGYYFNKRVTADNVVESEITDDFCNSFHALNPPVDQTILCRSLPACPLSISSDPVDLPLANPCSLQFKGAMGTIEKDLPLQNAKNVLGRMAKAERVDDEFSNSLSRRRSLQYDSNPEEGRSSKQMAISAEESVLCEMVDKMLNFVCEKDEPISSSIVDMLPNGSCISSDQDVQSKRCKGGLSCTKKRIGKRDHVDMKSVLIQCMESLASSDYCTADKLLKQIKQWSSPSGNASQRLAHCFAKGLEARLAGTGSLIYRRLDVKVRSTSDALKAYQLSISATPFINATHYYTTQTILELAKNATSLHIIQFGSRQGIHFMPLIEHLSNRPGGPPKLRITGIDFPEPGFRPAAIVEDAGWRLRNYCKRLNVPFEFHGMTQNWETVDPEDLKIQKGEVLVVMCLYHLHLILDDIILENSPRDAVLRLIKRINPDIFIHGVSSAPYNSPYFVSRFREALFHFSAIFDMFEATMPSRNPWRMVYETEIWGKEILNIIACEGLERVVRPETYKKWQARTLRAGFRQLPLNQEILKKIKAKVKSNHHKDFFVDEASQWMVQGWKSRVFVALSCWKP